MSARSRKVLQAAAWAATGAGAALILARLLVRDRLPAFSALHYAAPPVVPAAFLLIGGAAAFALRRFRWTLAAGSAALACISGQLIAHLAFRPQSDAPLRVLSWNAARGRGGWEGIAVLLAREKPDVALLGEAGKGENAALKAALPSHEWRWMDGGLAAAVRGRVLDVSTAALGPGSRAARLRVEVDGRVRAILLADLAADPFYDRSEVFARLNVLRAGADLVAGDFNTPGDSVHFDPWRRDLLHAFDAAGRGWGATWPSPLPLLAIDHVWCGTRVAPRRCRLVSSPASDHRAVVVDLELAD